MANRAQRRAAGHGLREEPACPKKAPPCPETGGRHTYLISGSQVVPVPSGTVMLIVMWSCPCGATRVNQTKVGESQAGLAIPGAGLPAELLKGLKQ